MDNWFATIVSFFFVVVVGCGAAAFFSEYFQVWLGKERQSKVAVIGSNNRKCYIPPRQ